MTKIEVRVTTDHVFPFLEAQGDFEGLFMKVQGRQYFTKGRLKMVSRSVGLNQRKCKQYKYVDIFNKGYYYKFTYINFPFHTQASTVEVLGSGIFPRHL
jgi:hypothetical protein